MSACILAGLYAITDPDYMPAEQLLGKTEQALRGGCRVLQYRNKQADSSIQLQQAKQLKKLCNRYQALFIVNDDVELALAVRADGLHIGQQDEALSEARKRLGNDVILGVSCHGDLTLAEQAQKQGADYVAFGRFFKSHTKPRASVANLAVLSQARQCLDIPVVAIGGITRDNAPLVIEQGADMIAVIHDLFAFDDVEERAGRLVALFN